MRHDDLMPWVLQMSSEKPLGHHMSRGTVALADGAALFAVGGQRPVSGIGRGANVYSWRIVLKKSVFASDPEKSDPGAGD